MSTGRWKEWIMQEVAMKDAVQEVVAAGEMRNLKDGRIGRRRSSSRDAMVARRR
jgi:hypothetical protein